MSEKSIKMTKGDTGPSSNFTITRNGSAVTITGATILVKGREVGETSNTFSREATIDDGAAGTCHHDWQAGDLDFIGKMILEIQITYSGGAIETAPRQISVIVGDEH